MVAGILSFVIRTVALVTGESPWLWETRYAKQCTWYVYYRALQVFGFFPCYNDRKKKVDGYTHGKLWMENFKEPWYPHYFDKEPDIEFLPGDIIVFDGNCGHVVFVEKVEDHDHVFISQYNLKSPLEFSNDIWARGGILKGYPHNTGPAIGLLRCESKIVKPVSRNEYVDQIYASDPTLRVRLEPSLNGKYFCSITPGYYNVLSTAKASKNDKALVEGLECWYEIEEGKYCANITTEFYEAKDESIKGLEKIIKEQNKKIAEYEDKLEKINKLSEVDM